MQRRAFLAALPAVAGLGRVYFDMGAAWQKNEAGLWLSHSTLGLSMRMMKGYQEILDVRLNGAGPLPVGEMTLEEASMTLRARAVL